jgi:hypothetical protein
MKIGDQVKIIDRLPDNNTGLEDYMGRGDIGKIGFVENIQGNQVHIEQPEKKYLGWFKIDVEVVLVPNDYEIY